MKLLFESWREYLKERIDSSPSKVEEPWDLGETFPQITKLDIIENHSRNIHQKNTLLDFFNAPVVIFQRFFTIPIRR